MKFKKLWYSVLLCAITFAITAQPKSFTVVLDWFVNPQHAPIIIAQAKGFFAQAGLDVSIIQPANPADPVRLVATKQADIGIDYQPELYLQVASGIPIVRVGTLIANPLRVVATLASSKIKTLHDLTGNKIGASVTGTGDAILTAMLHYNHVDPKTVEITAVNYDLIQALLSKRVAAVSGVQRNFEVPELALAGQTTRVFYPENNGVPRYDELIFIANQDRLHDVRLLAFMQAIKAATQYIKQHPDEAWQIMAKTYPVLIKPHRIEQLNHIAWNITYPFFAPDPLSLDKKRYHEFALWLQQQHLLTNVLPVTHYAVDLRKL
jgi:putative hydroxymethylpyrimidine transport system substrate-binding protein